MRINRLQYEFKKTWDWLWNLEERALLLSTKKELASHRRMLQDLRMMYESEREMNRVLNLFIENKLKSPPNRTYVCNHCDFRGKEYRDFCPGCQKDSSGNRAIDYYNTQK